MSLIRLCDSAWSLKNWDDAWYHYSRFKKCLKKDSGYVALIISINSDNNNYIEDYCSMVIKKSDYVIMTKQKRLIEMLIAFIKSFEEYKDYWRFRDTGLKIEIVKKKYVCLW